MRLVWFLYQIIFGIGFVATAPYYGWRMWRRGHLLQGFAQRCAFYGASLKGRLRSFNDPLWIHAVSVGEMLQACVLVEELRKRKPDLHIVVTTTTVTGKAVGKQLVNEKTIVMYNPFDFLWCVKTFYRFVNPRMLLLVEQELWPNVIWEARKHRIPIWVANARMSERSAKRMQKYNRFMRHVLGEVSWVGVQDEREIERMAQAGYHRHVIFPVGSLKFEVALLGELNEEQGAQLRKRLGWDDEALVLFAGSTHLGEEKGVIKYYKKAQKRFPNLKLVLAPRHVERKDDVVKLCMKHEVTFALRSECTEKLKEQKDVMILDTTGELRHLYDMGNVVFVGKSLHGVGGQNFLEAARIGKAVVVGPNMQNFPYLTELFIDQNGLKQVGNWDEFEKVVDDLFEDADKMELIGKNARNVFAKEMRAGRLTVEAVVGALDYGK